MMELWKRRNEAFFLDCPKTTLLLVRGNNIDECGAVISDRVPVVGIPARANDSTATYPTIIIDKQPEFGFLVGAFSLFRGEYVTEFIPAYCSILRLGFLRYFAEGRI